MYKKRKGSLRQVLGTRVNRSMWMKSLLLLDLVKLGLILCELGLALLDLLSEGVELLLLVLSDVEVLGSLFTLGEGVARGGTT